MSLPVESENIETVESVDVNSTPVNIKLEKEVVDLIDTDTDDEVDEEFENIKTKTVSPNNVKQTEENKESLPTYSKEEIESMAHAYLNSMSEADREVLLKNFSQHLNVMGKYNKINPSTFKMKLTKEEKIKKEAEEAQKELAERNGRSREEMLQLLRSKRTGMRNNRSTKTRKDELVQQEAQKSIENSSETGVEKTPLEQTVERLLATPSSATDKKRLKRERQKLAKQLMNANHKMNPTPTSA
jgi:hypothetical protein